MSSYNACWDGGSSVPLKEKEILDRIVAATRAEEDEIKYMLKECDGDVNEAVNRLMDNPFTSVKTKKGKRGSRKSENPSHVPRDRRDALSNRVVEVPKKVVGNGNPRSAGRVNNHRSERAAGNGSSIRASVSSPTTVPDSSRTLETSAKPANPLPLKWGSAGSVGSNFADVLRRDAKLVQVGSATASLDGPSVREEMPCEELAVSNDSAKRSAGLPPAVGMNNTADKLSPGSPADAVNSAIASISSSHTVQDAAAVSGLSSGSWVSTNTGDVQTESLAGLLAASTSAPSEDDGKSVLQLSPAISSSNSAGALSLQFGQFSMAGTTMGDFGSGFGSGFGDEPVNVDVSVSPPSSKQVMSQTDGNNQKGNSGFAATAEPLSSYQSHQPFSYGHAVATSGITSLGNQTVHSSGATPPAASMGMATASDGFYTQSSMYPVSQQSAAETASFPAYGDDSKAKSTSISISGQESTGFQYSQNSAGREEDFPVSSSSSAPKFVVPAGRSDVVTNLSATREASQSSVVSSAPATATPVQQPVVPQMHAFPHGIPPSLAAQYGYIHHAQYPYMHNTNMYMYPNYPHPAYTGGAAYPPQAGQGSNFPPTVGSTTYPTQVQSANGPVKYPYPYAQQNSQSTPSTGIAPAGFGSYSAPGGFSADEPGSGAAYSKDPKDAVYGNAGSQAAPQIVRDSSYMYMTGQGYQQQGYGAAAQTQYNNSSYAQYMANVPYTMGGQMHPPNLAGQSGNATSANQGVNLYKLQ